MKIERKYNQHDETFTVKEAIFDYLCSSDTDDFISKLVNVLHTNGILSDDDIIGLLGRFYQKHE